MEIKEALAQLDPNNDSHWTTDGAPMVAVMSELTGIKDLKRRDIIDEAPKFTRSNTNMGVVVDLDFALRVTQEQLLENRDLFRLCSNVIREDVEKLNKQIAALQAEAAAKTQQENLIGELELATQPKDQAIRNYIDAQNATREQKLSRARRFVESGTTEKDVLNALDGRSQLDKDLSSRKAVPGSTRPARLASKAGG